MLKKELDYMEIEYTEKDLEYIDELIEFLQKSTKEIIDFFEIKQFGKKAKVKLFNNLEKFRNKVKSIGYNLINVNVPLWFCGCAYKNTIYILSLSEYRKTASHENGTIEDLKHLIMHEFIHVCHIKVNKKTYAWLGEGLATTLSHQYKNKNIKFNASLDDMVNGCSNYNNYYIMFNYVYSKFGKDYIMSLIKNYKLLKKRNT